MSTDFVKSDNVCVCYADSDYSTDEQTYIFYGVRTNADFLVHNGFVYPDNEHDAVKIRLGVSRSDPLYSLRCRLLQTLSLPALAEFYLTLGPCPVDGKLLAFVRIFNMDQSTYHFEYPCIPVALSYLQFEYCNITIGNFLFKKCIHAIDEKLEILYNILKKEYIDLILLKMKRLLKDLLYILLYFKLNT